VPPPYLKGRAPILAVHSCGKRLSGLDLQPVRRQNSGLQGPELAKRLQRAGDLRRSPPQATPTEADRRRPGAHERSSPGAASKNEGADGEGEAHYYLPHEGGHELMSHLVDERAERRRRIVARGDAIGDTFLLP